MSKQYKKGDKHPTKDRIFWSYTHRDRSKAKEQWLSPKAFENKEKWRKDFQASKEYKEKSKKDYERKKEYIYQRDKERKLYYRDHNPFALMLTTLKPGAKRRNLSFNITLADLESIWKKQEGKCYYTNIPMNFTYSLSLPKQMSLDRVDSSKGYTIDNVVLCCQFINYAKHDYKLEDFLSFLEELRKN